jgi:copper chaperone CopZ
MTIQRELGALEGVTEVRADVDTKEVTVEWDDRTPWQEIVELLNEINYSPA